jgi:hypothetical protein
MPRAPRTADSEVAARSGELVHGDLDDGLDEPHGDAGRGEYV